MSVWNATVTAGSDPAELAALAVKHAVDRRGVAHLVFPDEVQVRAQRRGRGGSGRPDREPQDPSGRSRARAAAAALRGAERPVIIVGHGARPARAEVVALAERLGAPVLTTFKAKGLVPDTTRSVPACSAAAARRWRAG